MGEYSGTLKSESSGSLKTINVSLFEKGGVLTMSGGGSVGGDGESAAPDFRGKLIEESGGILKFALTDSFGNEGEAKVSRLGSGIVVEFDITKVEEPRCMALYDTFTLQRVKKD